MDAELEKIIAYLLGEGELDGKWFGDPDVPLFAGKYPARYWWRSHLREAWNHRHSGGDGEAWTDVQILHLLDWQPLTHVNKGDRLWQILCNAGMIHGSLIEDLRERLVAARAGERG